MIVSAFWKDKLYREETCRRKWREKVAGKERMKTQNWKENWKDNKWWWKSNLFFFPHLHRSWCRLNPSHTPPPATAKRSLCPQPAKGQQNHKCLKTTHSAETSSCNWRILCQTESSTKCQHTGSKLHVEFYSVDGRAIFSCAGVLAVELKGFVLDVTIDVHIPVEKENEIDFPFDFHNTIKVFE